MDSIVATTYAEIIVQELADTPETVHREVLNFLLYLKNRPQLTIALVVEDDNPPIHLLSEAALAEDWLSPEDEEAWKDL